MPDINLTCIECKNPFYFTERDQAFYNARNFQQPKRCYQCRQKRKLNSVDGPQAAQDATPTPARGKKRNRDYTD